jgi:signal transduction histidine kinase
MLSQELHDRLGAYLGGIAFRAKCLSDNLAKKGLAESSQAAEIVAQINDGIGQVRNFARLLSPVETETGNLVGALSRLASDISMLFGIHCNFAAVGKLPNFTKEQCSQLYRIAQEASRNAIQHGKCKQLRISLIGGADGITERITNDGLPLDSNRSNSPGLGLRIMTHRAASLGGSFTLSSNSVGQTEATCWIPGPGKIRDHGMNE